jgi:hypothetical protein
MTTFISWVEFSQLPTPYKHKPTLCCTKPWMTQQKRTAQTLWQSCPETSYISVSQHHLSQYGCHPETVEFISAYMTAKCLCPTQHWSCEDYLHWVATKTSYMHEIALKTVNSQTRINMKKWMCSPVPVHHLHQKWNWLDNIIPLTSRTCFPYHKWQPNQHTSHKHED